MSRNVSKHPFKSFNTTSVHIPCQNNLTKKKILIDILERLESRESFVYLGK